MQLCRLDTARRSRPIRWLALAGALAVAGACDSPVGPGADDASIRPNPLAGASFHVPHPSDASRQADAWRATRPADAAAMDRIAVEPRAVWLPDGDPVPTIEATLAAAAGETPVFVAYYIPGRDCSAQGAPTAAAYREWVAAVAGALDGRGAVVVLEPDALAQLDCAGEAAAGRLALLREATATLKAAGVMVYIDAGHPNWLATSIAAGRLLEAGVREADGFALNVANFVATDRNIAYGREIARLVGPTGFVIDTGRNGAGEAPDLAWCNPPGRRLGTPPTVSPADGVDALLWIKPPGESDGPCNGGPPAGEWWPEYALELAR